MTKLRDEFNEHPALGEPIWIWGGNGHADWTYNRCEYAHYRGHRLRIRHCGDFENPDAPSCNMGWVDDRLVGTRENMSRTCEMLFDYVDELEDRK